MPKTVFVVAIEGLDGAGKTTTARLLARSLAVDGYSLVRRHFEKNYIQGAYAAARRSGNLHVRYLIQIAGALLLEHEMATTSKPSLFVCDRYIYGARSYHRLMSGEDLVPRATALVRTPDLLILLDCSPSERRRRLLALSPPPSERKLSTTSPTFTAEYLTLLMEGRQWHRLDSEKLSPRDIVKFISRETEARLWRT